MTRIPERLTALARAWLQRLVAIGVVERSVALGSYAFTALIPLLVVYGALASQIGAAGFADRLSRRFRLTGSAAASVHQAFAPPGDVTQGITVLSIVLLIASALTLTRGLQRLYQSAYGLPSLGVRGMAWGLAWLALIPVFLELRALEAPVLDGVAEAVVTLAFAAIAWTFSPYVLLGRRLGWRVLLPGGLLTAAGMSVIAAGSILYMPRSVGSSATQYGLIGVAFALMSWLVACGFVLVGTAAGGAVVVGRGGDPDDA